MSLLCMPRQILPLNCKFQIFVFIMSECSSQHRLRFYCLCLIDWLFANSLLQLSFVVVVVFWTTLFLHSLIHCGQWQYSTTLWFSRVKFPKGPFISSSSLYTDLHLTYMDLKSFVAPRLRMRTVHARMETNNIARAPKPLWGLGVNRFLYWCQHHDSQYQSSDCIKPTADTLAVSGYYLFWPVQAYFHK